MLKLFALIVLLSFFNAIFHPIAPQRFLSLEDRIFFPSISWEGGGQNHRILIFFSASSSISNSLSREQINTELNLFSGSE